MPSNASLLQSIRLRLGRHLSPSFGTATDIADLYEAYIFSLVIRAALNEGAVPEQGGSLTFRDPSDNFTTNLLFRRSPGQIYTTAQPYTHAVIEFEGKPLLEVHIGIKAMGRLKVARECDIAILYRDKAIECRAKRRILKRLKLFWRSNVSILRN